MTGTVGESLRYGQIRTILLLFGGYAACYYCRADLSVATPLLVEELGRHGIPHGEAIVHIGSLTSAGVLAYALGKLFLTGLGDYWGGRRNFLLGVGGATAFTLLFAAGGALPVFTLAWIGNRLTQSVGWAGLIKVSSRWFDYSSYGTIIGILSTSYLIGDALARQQMGMLIDHGYGWRTLFLFAAIVAGAMLLASLLWLRESRTEGGHPEARPNPLNLFAGADARPASVGALLLPLLRSRAFVLVCVLSFACTIIRETFNTWTPEYLRDHLGYSMSHAASLSAIFPGVGFVSVLFAGWLSDQLGLRGRSLLLFLGLAGTTGALLVLMSAPPSATGARFPLLTIGLVAFCLLGPYSYLGGAFAADFGGKQASAASSGIIDGIGYLGGVLAGDSVARLSNAIGWDGVFVVLAAVSALAALCGGWLHLLNTRAASSSMTESTAAVRVSAAPDTLTVEWSDGRVSEFPSLWLRDNLAADRDAHSGQRLIDITDLPQQPRIRSAVTEHSRVRIEWEHETQPASFELAWLATQAAGGARAQPERTVRPWLEGARLDAARDFAWVTLAAARDDARLRLEWLTRLLQDGLAFVSEMPATEGALLETAPLIGRVLETNYGLTFDVRFMPQPENLAYSDLGLGLHTDNPYREPVPGFQALHALLPSCEGGASLFADGFALAADLRTSAPEDFALLTTTAVPFHYRSRDADLYAERPLIQLSTRGEIAAVHYNSRSIAPLGLQAPDLSAWYRAYRRFAALLRDSRFQLQTQLREGTLVVFDNQRILHGRTAFASAKHARHLRGCYLSRDSVYSETAVLRRQLATAPL